MGSRWQMGKMLIGRTGGAAVWCRGLRERERERERRVP